MTKKKIDTAGTVHIVIEQIRRNSIWDNNGTIKRLFISHL